MRVRIGGKVRNLRAVWYERGAVRIIDQRALPHRVRLLALRDHKAVADAIRTMAVRGAPSIGATAAYGLAQAKLQRQDLDRVAALLRKTRPTAYDLFYALDWMRNALGSQPPIEAADAYAEQIIEQCRAIGKVGAPLLKDGARILTHCNAGALATVDVGTSLAPIRVAHDAGRSLFVYVDETRPRLQGAKLTAWELLQEGIPHAVISDNAAGHFLKKDVDIVIVGADRITQSGDFANKIGTYEKAVVAHANKVPFYVAAPLSTFDFSLKDGSAIPIEERGSDEVLSIGRERLAPRGSPARNPAFDVTPRQYVTGFITDRGILRPTELRRLRPPSRRR